MYRTSGLVFLVLGGLLTWSIIFTPFDQEVRRWTRTEDGGRVRASVLCPDPYSILFEDEVNPDISRYENEVYCRRTARRLMTGGVLTGLLTLGLGIRGVARGKRPPLQHIRPLSELISGRRAGREDLDSS